MPKIEQNGPDFKYVVTYQRTDIENADEHVAVVQNPEAWHYVVPDRNLGIYKPFRITVKANNARGDSTANLNAVVGYSGEDGNTCKHVYSNCWMLGDDGFQPPRAEVSLSIGLVLNKY